MKLVFCFYFQPTIRFLVQILEKSEIARNGNWSVGNCVLAVCYSILLHHHTSATVTGACISKRYWCILSVHNLEIKLKDLTG